MANNHIKFEGDIALFSKFIRTGTWNTVFARHVRKATIKNCLYMIREIKQAIRDKNYTANAQLTLALKKGDIPLLDEKNLFDAITYQLQSSFNAEIGIFNAQSSGGVSSGPVPMRKLTELMHTGYTITVTPAMRAAIMAALMGQRNKKTKRLTGRAKASLKHMAKQSGSGNKTFRVPPRPFLTAVWQRPDMQKMIQRNWREALEQAFLEAGAKDGDHRNK